MKLTRVPSGENQSLEIGDVVPSVAGTKPAGIGTWSRLSAHRAATQARRAAIWLMHHAAAAWSVFAEMGVALDHTAGPPGEATIAAKPGARSWSRSCRKRRLSASFSWKAP